MAFEHNDIVTKYAMDAAIAEGGGGGGDAIFQNFAPVSGTFDLSESTWQAGYEDDRVLYAFYENGDYAIPSYTKYKYNAEGGAVTFNGLTFTLPDIWENRRVVITDGISADFNYVSLDFSYDEGPGVQVQLSFSTNKAEGSEPEIASASISNIGVYGLTEKAASMLSN